MQPDFAPKGIGRLVDESIAVYRACFRTLAVPAAMLLLPAGLFLGLAQGAYVQAVQRAALSSGGDFGAYLSSVGGAYAMFSAVVSLRSLISLYFFACVLDAGPILLQRKPVPPKEFLKGGARHFLMMFAVSIVAGVLSAVGAMFLLVPGILLAVYLSLAQVVAGAEGAPLDRAISRSFLLVRGHWWRTVGFFIAVGAVTFAISSAFTSFASIQLIIQQIAGVSGGPVPEVGWRVLGGVLQGVGEALTLPLSYVAILEYYLDLRSRREGMDLVLRAQALTPPAA